MQEFLFDAADFIASRNCKFISSGVDGAKISSVCVDSREVAPSSLFVALKGEKNDGHDYIEGALQKGASAIVCDEKWADAHSVGLKKMLEKHGGIAILAKSPLAALQDLAKFYREKFSNLRCVAVTGSNGKTTTKELVAAVLSKKYRVVKNDGNLNSDIGLPLSIFKIRKFHEIGVFECGMNREGEIAELAAVLSPYAAVVTNIGTAHIGIIGSRQKIAAEKKSIFNGFRGENVAFLNENDAFLDFLCDGVAGEKFFFGEKAMQIANVKNDESGGISFDCSGTRMRCSLNGRHNLQNVLAAIAVGRSFGLDDAEIGDALESFKQIHGRCEICEKRGVKFVNDAYNANVDSMLAAIDFCDEAKCSGKKIYIVGDMLELGSQSAEMHEKIASRLLDSQAAAIFACGRNFRAAFEKVGEIDGKSVSFLTDCSDCEPIASSIAEGDLVLFKSSNGVGLWKTAEKLVGA